MINNIFNRIASSFLLFILTYYIILKGSVLFIFFILLILILSLIEWHKMSYGRIYYIPGIFFLFNTFYIAYLIRNDLNEYNIFNFMFILSICIFTDIGGYIFGKLIKGPKLTKISPNKTYSGAIGGTILSYLGTLLFLNIYNIFYKIPSFTTVALIMIILKISFASQVGDLIVSFFKRKAGLKDTGHIIPGHGGVLDRIDGMIFAFPLSYYFNLII